MSNKQNDILADIHEENIKNIVLNALDLCGSYEEELKDYLHNSPYEYNSKVIQNLIFETIRDYPNLG